MELLGGSDAGRGDREEDDGDGDGELERTASVVSALEDAYELAEVREDEDEEGSEDASDEVDEDVEVWREDGDGGGRRDDGEAKKEDGDARRGREIEPIEGVALVVGERSNAVVHASRLEEEGHLGLDLRGSFRVVRRAQAHVPLKERCQRVERERLRGAIHSERASMR